MTHKYIDRYKKYFAEIKRWNLGVWKSHIWKEKIIKFWRMRKQMEVPTYGYI